MMPRRLEHLASRAARPDIKLTNRHPADIPALVNPHKNTTTPLATLTTSSEWIVKRCHSRLQSHISLFWQKALHPPSERSPKGDHEKVNTAGRRTLMATISNSSKCKTEPLTVNFRGFPRYGHDTFTINEVIFLNAIFPNRRETFIDSIEL